MMAMMSHCHPNDTRISMKCDQFAMHGLWTPSHTLQLYSSLSVLFPTCIIQLIQSYTLHPDDLKLDSTISVLSQSPYFFHIPNTLQFLFETLGRGDKLERIIDVYAPILLAIFIISLFMAPLPLYF